jgi:hypothetical protein
MSSSARRTDRGRGDTDAKIVLAPVASCQCRSLGGLWRRPASSGEWVTMTLARSRARARKHGVDVAADGGKNGLICSLRI